ncbi:MarR family winged helix-turn-helix transcriptional regulator [Paraburkholderia sp.]|uniref:MarR family winged helix-turn-helix transcriptional regulator n=1 Tax=Paraburkholderia sp. TaxID=1926495 RepID=UPI003D701CB9
MTDGPYHASEISPESSLGYYLSKARNVLAERMDRAVKPLGLTAQQIGIVLLLWHGRATTPFELSRALSYDSGSMTRMLDRLEKKGLIARTRSEIDRRMVKLELTPAGRDAATQLPELCTAVLNEQLHGFSPDELGTLMSLLGRFIANGSAPDDGICGVHGKADGLPGHGDE